MAFIGAELAMLIDEFFVITLKFAVRSVIVAEISLPSRGVPQESSDLSITLPWAVSAPSYSLTVLLISSS